MNNTVIITDYNSMEEGRPVRLRVSRSADVSVRYHVGKFSENAPFQIKVAGMSFLFGLYLILTKNTKKDMGRHDNGSRGGPFCYTSGGGSA